MISATGFDAPIHSALSHRETGNSNKNKQSIYTSHIKTPLSSLVACSIQSHHSTMFTLVFARRLPFPLHSIPFNRLRLGRTAQRSHCVQIKRIESAIESALFGCYRSTHNRFRGHYLLPFDILFARLLSRPAELLVIFTIDWRKKKRAACMVRNINAPSAYDPVQMPAAGRLPGREKREKGHNSRNQLAYSISIELNMKTAIGRCAAL